jgi:hypothetical protein
VGRSNLQDPHGQTPFNWIIPYSNFQFNRIRVQVFPTSNKPNLYGRCSRTKIRWGNLNWLRTRSLSSRIQFIPSQVTEFIGGGAFPLGRFSRNLFKVIPVFNFYSPSYWVYLIRGASICLDEIWDWDWTKYQKSSFLLGN